MFVSTILGKPSQDFTRPLGNIPRGLKGLLHMLNSIVRPTKDGFIFLFFVFHFVFSLSIAKGLAICKFRGMLSAKIFSF